MPLEDSQIASEQTVAPNQDQVTDAVVAANPQVEDKELLKGSNFLHQKDSKLHTTQPVEHAKKQKIFADEKVSQKPGAKINDWMVVLEQTHLGHEDNEAVRGRLRNYYHNRHVIKPEEVPESYFENQRRLARERGHGDVEITDWVRQESIKTLRSDQKESLDKWFNYFTHPDSKSYPMWLKYWSFNGMLKLSTYDKEKNRFNKRTKDTVAPFPDLNREALSYTLDVMRKSVGNNNLENPDEELKKLVKGANFGKIYAWALRKSLPKKESSVEKVNGQWVKYERGSDPGPLVESLQGHATGWCTAGESTASSQLQGGDFHVYYSEDEDGNFSKPRIAIRMEGDSIAEVRGVGPDQNLDIEIIGTDILYNKMDEFGEEGKRYQKKEDDMKFLTLIEVKSSKGEQLSIEELFFLHEIETSIEGFGHWRDPRIEELQYNRNASEDLRRIISNLPGHIEKLPKIRGLNEIEDIEFPQTLREIDLAYVNSIKNVTFLNPDAEVSLHNCLNYEDVVLPSKVKGFRSYSGYWKNLDLRGYERRSFDFERGERIENVLFNRYITHLRIIETSVVKDLDLTDTLLRTFDLRNVDLVENIRLPRTLRSLYTYQSYLEFMEVSYLNLKNLKLYGVENFEFLKNPINVENLSLSGKVVPFEGFKLPEGIKGLELVGFSSLSNIELPESLEKLEIHHVQSLSGVKLPQSLKQLKIHNIEEIKDLDASLVDVEIEFESIGSLENIKMSEGLSFLELKGIKNIADVQLPKSLVALNLDIANLDNIQLPENLLSLSIENCRKLENIEMPESLISLSLDDVSSLQNVTFPSGLYDLDIPYVKKAFNVRLPENLKRLHCHAEVLNDLDYPDGIKTLEVNGRLEGTVSFPKGLESLSTNSRTLRGVVLPENLRIFEIPSARKIEDIIFPKDLILKDLGELNSLSNVELPETLTSLSVQIEGFERVKLPHSLREIEFLGEQDDWLFMPYEELSNLRIKADVEALRFPNLKEIKNVSFEGAAEYVDMDRLEKAENVIFDLGYLEKVSLKRLQEMKRVTFYKGFGEISARKLERMSSCYFFGGIDKFEFRSLQEMEFCNFQQDIEELNLQSLRDMRSVVFQGNVDDFLLPNLGSLENVLLPGNFFRVVGNGRYDIPEELFEYLQKQSLEEPISWRLGDSEFSDYEDYGMRRSKLYDPSAN